MMIIGFSWGGWVLGSTAESMAKESANSALVAAFAPICVDRFMAQADAQMKLAEFQKTYGWQQRQLVEKGGWATLPGSSAPNEKVASACAEQLIKTHKT
jgi:alpha/beta superfamily hydrolase